MVKHVVSFVGIKISHYYFNYLAHFPTAFWAANHGSIFTLLVVVSMECPVGIKEFAPSIFGQFPTLWAEKSKDVELLINFTPPWDQKLR